MNLHWNCYRLETQIQSNKKHLYTCRFIYIRIHNQECISILWKHLDNLALKTLFYLNIWDFSLTKNTSKKPLKYRFNCKFACQTIQTSKHQPHCDNVAWNVLLFWFVVIFIFDLFCRNVVFRSWNWVNLEWHSFWKPRKINLNAFCVFVCVDFVVQFTRRSVML